VTKSIPIGARGEAEQIVEFRHTLTAHNPSLPPVFTTPNMIGLMEKAAYHALQPYCEEGEITLGTAIDIEHRAATGIGSRVQAEAVLEAANGRFFTLRVTARDNTRELGRGTVGRAVVQLKQVRDKFTDPAHPTATAAGIREKQKQNAEAFRALHRGPNILVLPNAWDVASATVLDEAGFPAIATTSAGIAFSLGYPDKQKISRAEMLGAISRIARAVKIPVSADIESGYGGRPEDIAHTARGVIECGAIGLNLEDADHEAERQLVDVSLQLEKIKAVRETGTKAGVPLVLNARTDVFLEQVGDPERRYDETVRRLAAYRDAGADCVFAPGIADASIIARLIKDLRCPVNILAGPTSPSIRELQSLGVARVSTGSSAMRASLGQLRRFAEELKTAGTYKNLDDAIPYAELDRLMGERMP
jgi:2-methylisocitrate lyase-like PEP mutase family enzyme/predicted thioesterase